MTAIDGPAARGARRRERTREKVLDAAEELLAERPVAALRVEDVAERSGVSAASIYVHFGTRDDLFAAAIDRMLEVAVQTMREAFASAGGPFNQFQAAGRAYLYLLVEHPVLAKYLTSGASETQSDAAQRVTGRFGELRREFEELISRAVEAKEMRRVDPVGLSWFLMAAWPGVAALADRRDVLAISRDSVEAAVIEASAAIVRGLARE